MAGAGRLRFLSEAIEGRGLIVEGIGERKGGMVRDVEGVWRWACLLELLRNGRVGNVGQRDSE